MHPVIVPPQRELAGHHALFLDIWALELDAMPKIAKYRLHSISRKQWAERNLTLSRGAPDEQQHYTRLCKIIKRHLQDRRRKQTSSHTYGTTEAFERKFAQRERYPAYKKAREEGKDEGRISSQNEILRSDWKQFLGTP